MATTLVVPRDRQCFVQSGCQFWLSRNAKRGLILLRAESRGHFVAEAGEMVHIDGKPSADPAADVKRAEGWIRRWVDPAQWALLRAALLKEIDAEKDPLRFYRLGADGKRRVEHVGAKPVLDLTGPLLF